jgi:hypothetical protein
MPSSLPPPSDIRHSPRHPREMRQPYRMGVPLLHPRTISAARFPAALPQQDHRMERHCSAGNQAEPVHTAAHLHAHLRAVLAYAVHAFGEARHHSPVAIEQLQPHRRRLRKPPPHHHSGSLLYNPQPYPLHGLPIRHRHPTVVEAPRWGPLAHPTEFIPCTCPPQPRSLRRKLNRWSPSNGIRHPNTHARDALLRRVQRV